MRALLLLAIVATMFVACDREPTLAIPRLTRANLDETKQAFDAGADGPRLLVFFSSGCAACDTGSAALQAMLDHYTGPVTVLAVWEPVKKTDPPPTTAMLDNLTDKRVRQVWDPDHIMSDEMRAAELAHPGSPSQARARTNDSPTGIMYDTAAIFAPGARWSATLPAAVYLDIGLEAILPELERRLSAP